MKNPKTQRKMMFPSLYSISTKFQGKILRECLHVFMDIWSSHIGER